MIERIPIESRAQWLALRERNIGASEAGALLGLHIGASEAGALLHDYLTPFEAWARKSG